jgi:Ni/Fe-hydrogenase subunit HybB-like protein
MRWERSVPVYGVPVFTRMFYLLCGIFGLAVVLTMYREYVGLGPTSGMTDAYAWGIWKTFNVMVLTGLGSGGFAVGLAAWVFNRHKLHSVMRIALLTSFLAYGSGLIMLGIDVGRPWNFYWVLMPWKWNTGSPLLEVAVCVTLYTVFPLFLENVPPMLEYVFYRSPAYRPLVEKIEQVFSKTFPFIIALAYLLPMMHQSSLGALMLLGGDRVHPLWQTPFLPLLYVWAAAFLGYSCVVLALLIAKVAWKRALDMEVMGELNNIASWLIILWTVFRFGDIIVRGQLGKAFAFDFYAALFWVETITILVPAIVLRRSSNLKAMFLAQLSIAVGGMIYRFSPTTLAFMPRTNAFYFPAVQELLICMGFVSLGLIGFLAGVKLLAILPANNAAWMRMVEYEKAVRPEAQLTGYAVAHD